MRPQVISNRNGLAVDVEYLLSCSRTPCDPKTTPDPGAIFFTAGTNAANSYGVTPEAGRVDSGLPEGMTLEFVQQITEDGFTYSGNLTGVTPDFVGFDPDDPDAYVPALWQATDANGRILAQGVTQYNAVTQFLELNPAQGNGPQWQVNTVATVQIFPQV